KDERLFRLDRVRDLGVTNTPFERGNGRRPVVPNPAGAAKEVKVRFSAAAAPYIRERFGQHVRPLEDGGAEVNVAGDSERWLGQWVLSFGGEAEVVEPEWARHLIAKAAAAAIAQ